MPIDIATPGEVAGLFLVILDMGGMEKGARRSGAPA
jgi:hypothetical protein